MAVFGAAFNGGPFTEPTGPIGVAGSALDGPDVQGTSTNHIGVSGISSSATQPAIVGNWVGPANSATPHSGVYGSTLGNAPGVHGVGPANGVLGTARTTDGPNPTLTGGIGVKGESGSGSAVQGISASGPGIDGRSTTGPGALGVSQSLFGVAGVNLGGNSWGGVFVNAQATAPGANKPGLFVQGDFVFINGTKNAAIKTQKHGYRKMYAVEATENVFEDFGTVAIKNGKARVDLDEVFAETVNTGQKYQVYLTPKSADSKGLAVVAQDPRGFTIQELGGGTGSYDVDYRVVAKVRGFEAKRMERFDPPAMPTPSEVTVSRPSTPRPAPAAVPGGNEDKP